MHIAENFILLLINIYIYFVDDIFATSSSKPKAKKEKKTEAPKKTTTNVTDIFDDPLS